MADVTAKMTISDEVLFLSAAHVVSNDHAQNYLSGYEDQDDLLARRTWRMYELLREQRAKNKWNGERALSLNEWQEGQEYEDLMARVDLVFGPGPYPPLKRRLFNILKQAYQRGEHATLEQLINGVPVKNLGQKGRESLQELLRA